MFTDIVGSTEMTARLGDSAALELVRVHDALVRRGLEAYGGREIKHTGDRHYGFLQTLNSFLQPDLALAPIYPSATPVLQLFKEKPRAIAFLLE